MSFCVEQKLPENYFQEVMDAQTEMVKMHLNDLENPLVFSHYCGNMMATFKLILIMKMMLHPIALHFF